MSLALHYNIRRYTVGTDSNAIDPGADAEWWWTAAPAPLAIWLIGSIAFTAVCVLLWLVLRKTDAGAVTRSDPPGAGPLPEDREPIAYDTPR